MSPTTTGSTSSTPGGVAKRRKSTKGSSVVPLTVESVKQRISTALAARVKGSTRAYFDLMASVQVWFLSDVASAPVDEIADSIVSLIALLFH